MTGEDLGGAPKTGPGLGMMVLAPPNPTVALGQGHFPAAVWGGPLPKHFQQGMLSLRPHPSRGHLPVASEEEIDSLQEVGVPMKGVLRLFHGGGKIVLILVHDGPVRLRHPLVQPIRRQREVLVMPQARGRIRVSEHLPEHRITPFSSVFGGSNCGRFCPRRVGRCCDCREQQYEERNYG